MIYYQIDSNKIETVFLDYGIFDDKHIKATGVSLEPCYPTYNFVATMDLNDTK